MYHWQYTKSLKQMPLWAILLTVTGPLMNLFGLYRANIRQKYKFCNVLFKSVSLCSFCSSLSAGSQYLQIGNLHPLAGVA